MFAEPVLIAGFGSVGRRHFQNLRALGCERFVFYRTFRATIPDDETREFPATSDLAEALSHRPRIAVISNPSSKHVPVAIEAAKAGCHLFIEKPLSDSLADCEALRQLVDERGLTTMIGCQFRFHPLLVSLDRQLRAGRLGRVLGASAEWGACLPDWHPWEDHRQGYSARGDLGGGVILTLIHPIDYLYWLFGPVDDVQATVRRVPGLETTAEDDWAEILLRFANGVVGHVHLDYVQRPPVHSLRVWGEAGRATWDFHAGTLVWEAPDGSTALETVADDFERNTMFVDEMKHFLDAVERRQPSSIPLADGIAVLDIALRARQQGASTIARG